MTGSTRRVPGVIVFFFANFANAGSEGAGGPPGPKAAMLDLKISDHNPTYQSTAIERTFIFASSDRYTNSYASLLFRPSQFQHFHFVFRFNSALEQRFINSIRTRHNTTFEAIYQFEIKSQRSLQYAACHIYTMSIHKPDNMGVTPKPF